LSPVEELLALEPADPNDPTWPERMMRSPIVRWCADCSEWTVDSGQAKLHVCLWCGNQTLPADRGFRVPPLPKPVRPKRGPGRPPALERNQAEFLHALRGEHGLTIAQLGGFYHLQLKCSEPRSAAVLIAKWLRNYELELADDHEDQEDTRAA
jgi:hypothetical protein